MNVAVVAGLLTGALVLVAFVLFFLLGYQTEHGRVTTLRPIPAVLRLRQLLRDTAETGTRLHFAPGTGAVSGSAGAADTLNGLAVLDRLGEGAAQTTGRLTITTNDALTLVLAQNIMRGDYERAGRAGDYLPTDARLIAPTTPTTGVIAYVTGVQAAVADPQVSGSVVMGAFGDEFLLVGDTARTRGIAQIAGSTREQGVAVMLLTAGPENTLIGEEVYAAPAWLDGTAAHIAAVRVQDWLRFLIIGGIIVVVALRSAGVV